MHSQLQILNTLLDVRRACGWLREQLAGRRRDAVDRAELILAETLNNIVIHGSQPSGAVPILISLDLAGASAFLHIFDRGQPMSKLPDPQHPASMPDPLAEGGRGWALIQQCSYAVAYRSTGEGNCTEIEVCLNGEQGPN